MLWLSGVVVDRTFTPEGVNAHARLLINHRTYVFIRVLNFRGWSQPRNFLTAKFFRSTVHMQLLLTICGYLTLLSSFRRGNCCTF